MASVAKAKAGSKESLRVAVAQMKFSPSISGNVAKIRDVLPVAARQRADVVLFPECAITGYGYDFNSLRADELKAALTDVSHAVAKSGCNALVGTPIFYRRKRYNCVVAFDRRGRACHCYAKCHLTPSDRKYFTPGNAISLFELDGITMTTVICHERRYPELVRLAVMAGAKILFHPNAGMDVLSVSRKKRNGRDGIATRAFENAIYYVFANSVGPQGDGKWSAGDSKIVGPDERILKLADNESEDVLSANLDLSKATRSYAVRGSQGPKFLAPHWKRMMEAVREQAAKSPLHLRAESLRGLTDEPAQ